MAKALALDYRSSLINARKCILSNKSLLPEVNSINNNFKSLKKNNPTFVDFRYLLTILLYPIYCFRDDSPVKNITLLTKKPTEPQKKITLLKRPTPAPQPVEEPSTSVSPTTTTLSNDQEVVELLQKFANNLDETVFKKALDRWYVINSYCCLSIFSVRPQPNTFTLQSLKWSTARINLQNLSPLSSRLLLRPWRRCIYW